MAKRRKLREWRQSVRAMSGSKIISRLIERAGFGRDREELQGTVFGPSEEPKPVLSIRRLMVKLDHLEEVKVVTRFP